jgi:hypothetical protein
MAALVVTENARVATWKTIHAQVRSSGGTTRAALGRDFGGSRRNDQRPDSCQLRMRLALTPLCSCPHFTFYRFDPGYVLEAQAKHPDCFCLVAQSFSALT